MPATTITLLNQKGGVGKSSTTFHVAGTLARDGCRVLLIDVDPQASLTQAFIGPDAMRALPARRTVASLFGPGLAPSPGELVMPSGFDRVSVVAGSIHLTEHNVPSPAKAPRDQQRAVARLVERVRDGFDFILIDCPPNLHLCSWAALVASDSIVVPLQAEDFGSQGLAPVLDSVEAVRAKANPRLRLLGYLVTMYNARLAIHRAYEGMLRELYGPQVFEAVMPLATDFKEAIAARCPIAHHKPKGASAKAIRAIADELIARSIAARDPASLTVKVAATLAVKDEAREVA
jgi:chromosome partitioning protein